MADPINQAQPDFAVAPDLLLFEAARDIHRNDVRFHLDFSQFFGAELLKWKLFEQLNNRRRVGTLSDEPFYNVSFTRRYSQGIRQSPLHLNRFQTHLVQPLQRGFRLMKLGYGVREPVKPIVFAHVFSIFG